MDFPKTFIILSTEPGLWLKKSEHEEENFLKKKKSRIGTRNIIVLFPLTLLYLNAREGSPWEHSLPSVLNQLGIR